MRSLVLGQIKTDEKSSEITAIPERVNMLDIRGKLITTDAMGCQKDIAKKIRAQEGDYLFSVKGNQGKLNKAFEEKFPLKEINKPKYDSFATTEKNHGREETRLHIVSDVPDDLIDLTFDWKDLKKITCVSLISFRIKRNKKRTENADPVLYKFSRFNGREVCHSHEKSLARGEQTALVPGCGNE